MLDLLASVSVNLHGQIGVRICVYIYVNNTLKYMSVLQQTTFLMEENGCDSTTNGQGACLWNQKILRQTPPTGKGRFICFMYLIVACFHSYLIMVFDFII